MPLLAAICATLLMFYCGYVYSETHTDISYLVTHLYLITALILCGMVKTNVKSDKSKSQRAGSSEVSPETDGESAKDSASSPR